MSTSTILRKKGQFTIPVDIREALDIDENDTLTILTWGKKGFLVIPKKLKTLELLQETEKIAKEKGITLEEILADLEEIRHKA
jgi:bifunctional DNA-binding transcriptional regulator/antitoxin component of YhaV-PrlF toxin-antitoxin module